MVFPALSETWEAFPTGDDAAMTLLDRGHGGDGAWRALRILVVEGDALIQMLLCETLLSMGHQVCGTAFTETEAVEAAARLRPELMIVDARLARGGGGVAAVERVLADRWTPHIFVSGAKLASATLHPRAVTLQKPFQDRDLADAIARAMAD
jgi:CheY-like chemotaxis protein